MERKKFEGTVIASDIDGTFLGKHSRQVERNLQAVRYFCENGGRFTFATGRAPIFMRKALPNAAELINMPAITANGACLYDFQREIALEEHFLRMEDILRIMETVSKFTDKAGYRGAYEKGPVVPDVYNPYAERDLARLPDFMVKLRLAPERWDGLGLYKLNVMEEPDTLEMLFPVLKRELGDTVSVSRSGMTTIEIMTSGISKAALLKKAVEKYVSPSARLCTVGDYDNDLEMHAIADLAVCPANANERVKDACHVCLCDHDEGVIGDLVEYLEHTL